MSFSNTFDTTNPGSGVSNREDLTDVLSILAPEETPILSSASKQKASSTFVEWTVDSLSAPSTAGVAEGADVQASPKQKLKQSVKSNATLKLPSLVLKTVLLKTVLVHLTVYVV